MAWGEPGPGAQLTGTGEAGDVTDLGDEHRGEDPSDTVDGLDGLVTGVATQCQVGLTLEGVDLTVVDGEQLPQ
jgi:hypothetical protein